MIKATKEKRMFFLRKLNYTKQMTDIILTTAKRWLYVMSVGFW